MVAGGQGSAVAFEPRALHGRTILRQGPRLGQAGRRVDGLPFRRPACESQIHSPPATILSALATRRSPSATQEQAGNNFPEFSQSRTKLWQGLLTLPPRRPKDRSPTRTPAETRGPVDGGAERLDGATHFVARTSASTRSTFT